MKRLIEDEDSSSEDSDTPSENKRQKTETDLDELLFCPTFTKSAKIQRKRRVFEWEEELKKICGRPPLEDLSREKEISFQVVDIDYSYGNPHPLYGRTIGNSWTPYIRLFGVTEKGNSVTAKVHGFRPYFYLPVPLGFYSSDCKSLCAVLQAEIRKNDPKTRPNTKTYVHSAELIR